MILFVFEPITYFSSSFATLVSLHVRKCARNSLQWSQALGNCRQDGRSLQREFHAGLKNYSQYNLAVPLYCAINRILKLSALSTRSPQRPLQVDIAVMKPSCGWFVDVLDVAGF